MKHRLAEPAPQNEPFSNDPYEFTMFAAEMNEDTPSVDLHGMSVHEALRAVETFLYQLHPRGTEAVKIIHGKGEQKLRAALHTWLREQTDIIGSFRDATGPRGQGGVTLVAYKKESPTRGRT